MIGNRTETNMSPPVWVLAVLFFHCWVGNGRSTIVRANGLDFDVNFPFKKCWQLIKIQSTMKADLTTLYLIHQIKLTGSLNSAWLQEVLSAVCPGDHV